jgi:hypothetical protein
MKNTQVFYNTVLAIVHCLRYIGIHDVSAVGCTPVYSQNVIYIKYTSDNIQRSIPTKNQPLSQTFT